MKKVTTLRLKADTVKKIEKLAKEDNRSFNNMVETIILKYKPTKKQSAKDSKAHPKKRSRRSWINDVDL